MTTKSNQNYYLTTSVSCLYKSWKLRFLLFESNVWEKGNGDEQSHLLLIEYKLSIRESFISQSINISIVGSAPSFSVWRGWFSPPTLRKTAWCPTSQLNSDPVYLR